MSRTTRVVPVDGFWTTVDTWAIKVAAPGGIPAWWQSRCRVVGECGPFLDVLGDAQEAKAACRSTGAHGRAVRDAVAVSGTIALHADDVTAEALEASAIEFRRVIAARRYAWRGPALAPVVLELHTTDDEATLEAWWEDVWAGWPTIRLGKESTARTTSRRSTASAAISRLLVDLGQPPLGRPPTTSG